MADANPVVAENVAAENPVIEEEKFVTLVDQLIKINDFTSPNQTVFNFAIREYPLHRFTLKCRSFIDPSNSINTAYNFYIDTPSTAQIKLTISEKLLNAQTLDYVNTVAPIEKIMKNESEIKWTFVNFDYSIYRTFDENKKSIVSAWLKIEINVPKDMEFLELPLTTAGALTNFSKFFNNSKFSDFKVLVEDETFFVSKLILATNSPVFAASIDLGMKESIENRIEIPDSKANIIEQMLKYMYDNGTTLEIEHIDDLFIAADKYQIENLKLRCILMMSKNINAETAAPYVIIADRYDLSILKKSCVGFICSNFGEFCKTEECKKFFTEHVTLAIEISSIAVQSKA